MLKTPYYVSEIWPWYESYTANTTNFTKYDVELANLYNWVTQRPQMFELRYNEVSYEDKHDKVTYEEGDFFLLHIQEKNRYGAIRIVSESPRIIEIYITEPNI